METLRGNFDTNIAFNNIAPFPLSLFIQLVVGTHSQGLLLELLMCVSLFLCSSTNWTETQREKNFWMISSASCKKEVGNPVCACVPASACVFLPSQCKVCLSFTGLGGVSFFSCMTIALWSRSPIPCCSQANQADSCLGMDCLTGCLLTQTDSARTLRHTHARLTVTQPPGSILIAVTHTESKYPAYGSEHMG